MAAISEKVHAERAGAIRRVHSVRMELGYTVEYVAEVVGVSPATMRRWENLSHTLSPSARQVVAICRLYGISPTWALMGIGPKSLSELESGHVAGSAQGAMESLEDLTAKTNAIISELQERVVGLEEMVDKVGSANSKLREKAAARPARK